MNLDYVSIGRNPPEEVNAIIEVPIGGEPIKYEMDKKAGTLVVDRFLYTPTRYPGNYGFIPHTLSADGDPCDVLVANTRPIIPGAVIAVRPIGVLKMTDEGGGDWKYCVDQPALQPARFALCGGFAGRCASSERKRHTCACRSFRGSALQLRRRSARMAGKGCELVQNVRG
jgi:Inorganic pyrophosphatase